MPVPILKIQIARSEQWKIFIRYNQVQFVLQIEIEIENRNKKNVVWFQCQGLQWKNSHSSIFIHVVYIAQNKNIEKNKVKEINDN